jgi:hypothetical protein
MAGEPAPGKLCPAATDLYRTGVPDVAPVGLWRIRSSILRPSTFRPQTAPRPSGIPKFPFEPPKVGRGPPVNPGTFVCIKKGGWGLPPEGRPWERPPCRTHKRECALWPSSQTSALPSSVLLNRMELHTNNERSRCSTHAADDQPFIDAISEPNGARSAVKPAPFRAERTTRGTLRGAAG